MTFTRILCHISHTLHLTMTFHYLLNTGISAPDEISRLFSVAPILVRMRNLICSLNIYIMGKRSISIKAFKESLILFFLLDNKNISITLTNEFSFPSVFKFQIFSFSSQKLNKLFSINLMQFYYNRLIRTVSKMHPKYQFWHPSERRFCFYRKMESFARVL